MNMKKYSIVILALVLLAGTYLFVAQQRLFPFSGSSTNKQEDITAIGTKEKSESESKRITERQANPSKKTENQSDTPPMRSQDETTKKLAANLVITSAGLYGGNIEVRGYVSNIVEEGGSCNYTFTSTSSTFTKSTATHSNPTSTTCVAAIVPVSEFSKGSWSVSIEYDSPKSHGQSQGKEFQI